MTEKQIPVEELKEIIEEIFSDYITHYQADKMSFSEFVIVENILIKMDAKLRERGYIVE